MYRDNARDYADLPKDILGLKKICGLFQTFSAFFSSIYLKFVLYDRGFLWRLVVIRVFSMTCDRAGRAGFPISGKLHPVVVQVALDTRK